MASNATLKAIASVRPRSLDELVEVPEVRRRQVQDFGRDLLDRLDKIAPVDDE